MNKEKQASETHKNLLGKSKKEVLEELGEEFNFYPSDCWIYTLEKGWFGRNKYLVLYFVEEAVYEIKIKKCYGKINT